MARRVLFLGTPDAAVPVLEAIVNAGHDVVAVVSQSDAKRGRGGATSPTPVKRWALDHGLEATDDLDVVARYSGSDVIGVVVAFGRIIPKRLLDVVPMINVHFSLLPRWRGAAPVERAILAGDTVTGVCIMNVDETLDTGDVYARESIEISRDDTTATLTARLSLLGARLVTDVLRDELPVPTPQTGDVTYAHKVDRREACIDWTQPAEHVVRVVRALPAVTMFDSKRVRVLEARVSGEVFGEPGTFNPAGDVNAGGGAVRLLKVQPEGKSAMSCEAWLRGLRRDVTRRFERVP